MLFQDLLDVLASQDEEVCLKVICNGDVLRGDRYYDYVYTDFARYYVDSIQNDIEYLIIVIIAE